MKTAKEWKDLMDDEDSQVDMRQFLSDYEALESYCKGLEGQVMSPTGFSWRCRAEEAEKALEKERAKK